MIVKLPQGKLIFKFSQAFVLLTSFRFPLIFGVSSTKPPKVRLWASQCFLSQESWFAVGGFARWEFGAGGCMVRGYWLAQGGSVNTPEIWYKLRQSFRCHCCVFRCHCFVYNQDQSHKFLFAPPLLHTLRGRGSCVELLSQAGSPTPTLDKNRTIGNLHVSAKTHIGRIGLHLIHSYIYRSGTPSM